MFNKTWANVFLALSVLFLGAFGYFLWADGNGQMTSLIAVALCLVASRFGDLKTLKVTPGSVHAEMQSVVKEAKATIDQLHSLAISQSKFMLQMNQAEGRWGGASRAEKDRIRSEILSILVKLEVDRDAIEEVKSVEYPYQHFDYCSAVTKNLKGASGLGLSPAQQEKFNAFFSSDIRKGIGFEPSPNELEEFLQENDLIDDEVKERLLDYRQFHEHQTHRRKSDYVLGSE
ncbi:hypothetical protein Q669_19065 [Labrenzia sp. C1B10]|uniref:hypothetical protein n=1 Tax=unclassified Labrenzia TaxID=2648686 RepID=UPI0003B92375|nr:MULTISPECIES: hypothetical protein [unclassified Labrenzia]ERP98408.1 hypothetical protein Q669_19065 [Labrenzia sp. C1B10]ERP99913.1 hypothetical protein Q675_10140 [Labrenzia sp. C1B70]